MDLTLLETLRDKIVNGKVFSDTFTYFYDHFGENLEFIELSEPTQNDLLLELMGQVGGMIFKTSEVRLGQVRLLEVKGHHFIHGGLTINGAPSNVIYCDDLKKGIVAVYRPGAKPPMHFSRFSAEMLAPNLVRDEKKFRH